MRVDPPETEPTDNHLNAEQVRALRMTFAAPSWLRDLGLSSWFLVGFFILAAGMTWVLGTAATIVTPVVAATVLATVAMPLVAKLKRHRVPRAAGAAIVLLLLLAIAVVIGMLVIGGVSGQRAEIAKNATAAADHVASWGQSAGVSESESSGAKASVESDVPKAIAALTKGVINGISGLTSLVFGLSLALLSTFFLLKDGPAMRVWVDDRLGVPRPVGKLITGGVIRSLRGYFRGVTIIAVFNGAVVALGAFILGVPLAGTIGVVTYVTAYVPFIGAFVAGAFAVVIALGADGPSTALIMLVIVLLANGLLQNVLQPFAMGSALDLNPLVVLILTIAAGCLFGMVGLILVAPLTSAAVHILRDLKAVKTGAPVTTAEAAAPHPAPAPSVGA